MNTVSDPTFPSDAELLAALVSGSNAGRNALSLLAKRYVSFVYAAALRQLRDRAAAEDVTQAVFIVFSRKAAGIRPAALPAWLHQTTRNISLNLRRSARNRRRREQAAARPEAVMAYVLPEPDPLLPLLDDAIASLNARDRQAIIDRYLRGQDILAVASGLGVTPAAAQKRLERAMTKLCHSFAKMGYHPATLGVVTATLTAAAASSTHAAPPSVAANIASHLAAHASPSAAVSSKGIVAMLATSPIKVAAVVVGAIALGGLTVEAVHVASAQAIETAPASMDAPSQHKSSDDFPNRIAFKSSEAHFAPGDNITITEVRSTENSLQGGICRITGTYRLASQSDATLAGSVASRDPRNSRWNDAQQLKITKGHGEFKLLVPISVTGLLHVSFYGAGNSFGDVYFNDGTASAREDQLWSVDNSFPKLAPFTAIRWQGDTAEVQVDHQWYQWLSLDGRDIAAVVTDAKKLDARAWQKRLGEDLVELCARSGHPVNETVTLGLRRLDGSDTVKREVTMSPQNRQSVMQNRN